MSRTGGKTRGLSAGKIEDLGLFGSPSVSGEEVPVDARLGLVLQAREDVEVELEEAFSVLRANSVREDESQEVSLVVGGTPERAESGEGRHGEGR